MRIQSVNNNYINNYSVKNPNSAPQFGDNVYLRVEASCRGNKLCTGAFSRLPQACYNAVMASRRIKILGRVISGHSADSRTGHYLFLDKTTPSFSDLESHLGDSINDETGQLFMGAVDSFSRISEYANRLPLVINTDDVCKGCANRAEILINQTVFTN